MRIVFFADSEDQLKDLEAERALLRRYVTEALCDALVTPQRFNIDLQVQLEESTP